MKKKFAKFLTLITVFLVVFLFSAVLVSCDNIISVVSIGLKDYQDGISVEVGEFDFSDYTLVVN